MRPLTTMKERNCDYQFRYAERLSPGLLLAECSDKAGLLLICS